MKAESPVVLNLKVPFLAVLAVEGIILWAVWSMLQFDVLACTELSVLLLPCMLFCLWRVSIAVKLGDTYVDTFTLFGLGLSAHQDISNIRMILLQPDHLNDITSITLEFSNGQHLKLSDYYSNFCAAHIFILRNWPEIPHRVLAPTAKPVRND